MDVAALKATDYLHDRIDFADVTQELIAESFTRARAFDQTGNIEKLDCCRHDFWGTRKFSQFCQPRIGQGHDPDVDAVTRLNADVKTLRMNRDSVLLAPNTWTPVNSQNTAIAVTGVLSTPVDVDYFSNSGE